MINTKDYQGSNLKKIDIGNGKFITIKKNFKGIRKLEQYAGKVIVVINSDLEKH